MRALHAISQGRYFRLSAVVTFIDERVLAKGALGMAGVFGGAGVSFVQALESWLRITSLCVGIAVGVATFVSIMRKNSK